MFMNASTIAENAAVPLGNKGISYHHYRTYFDLLNNKVLLAAIIVLLLALVLVLAFQIYAKCFSGYFYITGREASLRSRDSFAGQEGSQIIRTGGIEESIIQSLPTFLYEVPHSNYNALECAVCLCEFQVKERGRKLPKCSHSFHTDCIDMWFSYHSTCPVCRTSVLSDPLTVTPDSDLEICDTLTGDTALLSDEIAQIPVQLDAVDVNPAASQTTESEQPNAEGFHEQQGLQYPTNVLFWGDRTHVSSCVTSQRLEHGQPGGRSMSHIGIDMPRRSAGCSAHRCLSTTILARRGQNFLPLRCSSMSEQSCSSNCQPMKSSVPRLKSLQRFLAREGNISLAEQDGGCDQLGYSTCV